MNNSVYGKTMENVRNRIDFKLIQKEDQALRVKNLKRFTTFADDLIGVHCNKNKVVLNKPIYLGQNILDDSKVLMADFHYNFMLKNISRDNIDLLFTDTDSLMYQIRNFDVFDLINKNKDLFDLSEMNKDDNLYNTKNKKVIGKMKIETGSDYITEFVGLRPKMYSYKTEDEHESKKCKGVKLNVINSDINFNDYKNTNFNKEIKVIQQNGIRSYKHQLYTETVTKIGLSFNDDKVYIEDNMIDCFNFGHYKTLKI